jgi:hypothetical protein
MRGETVRAGEGEVVADQACATHRPGPSEGVIRRSRR